MRVSASLRSGYDVASGPEAVRQALERVAAAAEAGLHGLYVGDHHAVAVPYLQNGPLLGRLLAEWPADRSVGALYLVPLWNPVLVAEQVATLASMTAAPFVFQAAIGGDAAQFEAMGARLGDRVRVFESSLATIHALLDGSPDAPCTINPRPPRPVETWIGASAAAGIERAARLADAWYAGPGEPVDVAAQKLVSHLAARPADRPATRRPIRRDVYVASSADDATRVRDAVAASGYRGFDPGVLVIGTPDDVVERFEALAAAGFDEVVVRQLVDDQADALASYRRLGPVVDAVAS